jgi:hypothetical protein
VSDLHAQIRDNVFRHILCDLLPNGCGKISTMISICYVTLFTCHVKHSVKFGSIFGGHLILLIKEDGLTPTCRHKILPMLQEVAVRIFHLPRPSNQSMNVFKFIIMSTLCFTMGKACE